MTHKTDQYLHINYLVKISNKVDDDGYLILIERFILMTWTNG